MTDELQAELGALGEPPSHLNRAQKANWRKFRDELPWLTRADRALVELATLMRPHPGSELGQVEGYCEVLAKLGATPFDRRE